MAVRGFGAKRRADPSRDSVFLRLHRYCNLPNLALEVQVGVRLAPARSISTGDGMEFGPRLKQFRLREQKTQEQLADAMDLDVTYVSKLEKPGGPIPRREKVEAAADFLQLSEDEREELLLLAAHMPPTVQDLATRPAARQLLRSLSQLSDDEQERLLDDMLRQIGDRRRNEPESGPYAAEDDA